MSPLAPALFVLEKFPRWESELKRRIAGRQLLVRPCRSASDVVALSRHSPGSVVVIDFAAGAADGLRLLEALDRRARSALAIVIAAQEQAELEWPARELGAKAFVSDTIGGAAPATLCRRMFGACAWVAGAPQRIWRAGRRAPIRIELVPPGSLPVRLRPQIHLPPLKNQIGHYIQRGDLATRAPHQPAGTA